MNTATSARYLPLLLDRENISARPPGNDFPGQVATDRAAREEILHRAYAIWAREGRPENRSLAHWLEAESEILPHG